MNVDIFIGRATIADLETILKMQHAAFLSEAELYNNYNIAPLTQTIDSIKEDYNNHLFLKAEINQKIVGSVRGRITGSDCQVGRLIVDPDFQNRGIGKKLMIAIEKEFSESTHYVLFTGSKSDKNIKLYESLGYKKIEVFHDENNPDVERVKMFKVRD